MVLPDPSGNAAHPAGVLSSRRISAFPKEWGKSNAILFFDGNKVDESTGNSPTITSITIGWRYYNV